MSKETIKDNINPSHYANYTSLECIEVMELVLGFEPTLNFCLGNAFKYMWRWKNKNGEEDLEKAQWYLDYVERYINSDMDGSVPIYIVDKYNSFNDLLISIHDKIANGIK